MNLLNTTNKTANIFTVKDILFYSKAEKNISVSANKEWKRKEKSLMLKFNIQTWTDDQSSFIFVICPKGNILINWSENISTDENMLH